VSSLSGWLFLSQFRHGWLFCALCNYFPSYHENIICKTIKLVAFNSNNNNRNDNNNDNSNNNNNNNNININNNNDDDDDDNSNKGRLKVIIIEWPQNDTVKRDWKL
jgi:hypothetical protein